MKSTVSESTAYLETLASWPKNGPAGEYIGAATKGADVLPEGTVIKGGE